MKKTIVFFALLFFIISGCKKTNDSPDNKPGFLLERAQYHPLEIAQLSVANLVLTDSIYSGTINGTDIQFRNHSGRFTFFVPQFQSGNYTIQLRIEDKQYAIALLITDLPALADPSVYLQNAITQSDLTATGIMQLADSLDPANKTAVLNDLQTVNTMLSDLYVQYNSLSSAEKEEFAKVIEANKWWLDEVHAANAVLLTDVSSYKTELEIADHEQRVNVSMAIYVNAVAKVVSHIPKIVAFAAAGGLIGSVLPVIGTGIGASLGAGIGIGLMVLDMNTLMASIDHLANTAIIPTDDFFANKTTSAITFFNHQERKVKVEMNYRSIYQADANTTIPVAAKFVKGLVDFRNAYMSVKSYLPSSLRSPKLIGDVADYKLKNIPVNSNHLSVSNISNNNVRLTSIQKTSGNLLVKFETLSTEQQSFSFKINYSNADFGNHSKTIDADILYSAPELGMHYQGGIIFYFLSNGDPGYDPDVQHGLVVYNAPYHNAFWGCKGTNISGAQGTALGTGNQNTINIATQCPSPSNAASYSYNATHYAYTDWYLPSKDELALMYLSRNYLNQGMQFTFWSSSQINSNQAWAIDAQGQFIMQNKDAQNNVYSIRAF